MSKIPSLSMLIRCLALIHNVRYMRGGLQVPGSPPGGLSRVRARLPGENTEYGEIISIFRVNY